MCLPRWVSGSGPVPRSPDSAYFPASQSADQRSMPLRPGSRQGACRSLGTRARLGRTTHQGLPIHREWIARCVSDGRWLLINSIGQVAASMTAASLADLNYLDDLPRPASTAPEPPYRRVQSLGARMRANAWFSDQRGLGPTPSCLNPLGSVGNYEHRGCRFNS